LFNGFLHDSEYIIMLNVVAILVFSVSTVTPSEKSSVMTNRSFPNSSEYTMNSEPRGTQRGGGAQKQKVAVLYKSEFIL